MQYMWWWAVYERNSSVFVLALAMQPGSKFQFLFGLPCVLLVCTELESAVYADWKLQSSKRCIWNKDSIFCNKIVVRAFCARPVSGKYAFVQLPKALFLVITLVARFILKTLLNVFTVCFNYKWLSLPKILLFQKSWMLIEKSSNSPCYFSLSRRLCCW